MSGEYQSGDFGLHGAAADEKSEGAGFFDAAMKLDEAVKENNQVAEGLMGTGLGLETLGLIMDPIGSVLAAGIGWIIEHVSILRWPLDTLMGDPVGIKAADEALKTEKRKLEDWSKKHQDELDRLISEWSGDGADRARRDMEAVADQLSSLGGYLESAADCMKITGGVIGAVRGVVRDIIAITLANIVKAALIALALAPLSFGASIAACIVTIIGMVATALGRVGTQIARLVSKLSQMAGSLKNLGNAGGQATSTKPPGSGGNPTSPQSGGNTAGGGSPSQAPPSQPPTKPPNNKLNNPIKDALTPQQYETYKKISNFTRLQLEKVLGKDGAKRFENAVKLVTDPTAGPAAQAVYTIVQLVKGVPTSAVEAAEKDDERK